MRDLAGEELQKAVQLVGVPPQRRCELRRIGLRRGLERAHVDLQPVPELLDAAEHAHGVALREARVEQLDVVPDARVDAAARIDELEREVRGAALRAQPLLARDRVDALDDPLFGQLCDCAHDASLGPNPDARVGPNGRGQAVPRRALRRVEGRPAGAARGAAVRRDLARAARGVPRAQPLQRRPPDASRRRGAGRPGRDGLARTGRARAGPGARLLVPFAGLRRSGRRFPHEIGVGRLAPSGALRERGRPPARAHASRAERGPAPAAPRHAHAARADLSPLRGGIRSSRLRASPISRAAGTSSGVSRTLRASRTPSS